MIYLFHIINYDDIRSKRFIYSDQENCSIGGEDGEKRAVYGKSIWLEIRAVFTDVNLETALLLSYTLLLKT